MTEKATEEVVEIKEPLEEPTVDVTSEEPEICLKQMDFSKRIEKIRRDAFVKHLASSSPSHFRSGDAILIRSVRDDSRNLAEVVKKREAARERETEKVVNAYDDLGQLIDEVATDENTKEKIKAEFDELQEAYEAKIEGELQRQQDQFDFEWEIRKSNDKTQRIIRLLDRDLVAVIIGGILLIMLAIALIVLIYNGKVEPTLLESAFFVILGFFFGQGISQTRSPVPTE